MKTAEEKAKELVDDIVENDGLDIGATLQRAIEKRIAITLKEQDLDTRHACVDSVLDVDFICETPTGDNAYSIDDVTSAIMNTKAV